MDPFKTLIIGTPPSRTYTASATGLLTAANNLSDVADGATAAGNLGLGSGDTAVFTGVSGPAATTLTLSGGSSGAEVAIASGSNASVTITNTGTGLVNIDSSATATQARLNINLLSPGVAATQEAVTSYQAYDSGSANFRQLGAMGAYWVDAGATGYSAVFMHAADYNGGGSNNDVRVSAGHGILIFATDNTFPGAGIMQVRGTLDMQGAITSNNNYTATAATPIVSVVSNSASSLSQIRSVNATTRAISLQSFGDSAAGTTFGVTNAAAATLTTGTTGSFYPSNLLIGTLGSAAPIVFGVNNTEVGRFSSTALTLAGNLIHAVPASAPSLTVNSTLTWELTSNTSLKAFVRGSDGTTRSVTLTLA